MNDEIREIFDTKLYFDLEEEDYIKIKDYITNLQQENQKLKEKLNCKEYFSSTMPEDTEFVILTKNNYDRQQKDIQLELIDYKSRVEKTTEKLSFIDEALENDTLNVPLCIAKINSALNILQNGSDGK